MRSIEEIGNQAIEIVTTLKKRTVNFGERMSLAKLFWLGVEYEKACAASRASIADAIKKHEAELSREADQLLIEAVNASQVIAKLIDEAERVMLAEQDEGHKLPHLERAISDARKLLSSGAV